MEVTTEIKNNVRIIKFSNTRKKNAIGADGYDEITKTFNTDINNKDIVMTIITGEGQYFTSGQDLSKQLSMLGKMEPDEIIKREVDAFQASVKAIINYPKLLIAVVNGPAIGYGVTLCGLCDIVYASDLATFSAPFVKLGMIIECTGSYLFPLIMGKSRANELLLLGKKYTAQDAMDFKLVSKVFPKDKLDDFMDGLLQYAEKIPLNSLMTNKRLLMESTRKQMLESCNRECAALREVLHSEEFITQAMKLMERSKL